MPSTYTQNLGLEKPATGEQAGVWGVTADTNYDTLDKGIDGSLGITLSSSTYSLATNNGGPAAAGVNRLIVWTGAQVSPGGTVTIVPNTVQKIYYMQNKTTGGFPVVFSQGSGTTFTLQPGYGAILYADGGGAAANVAQALGNPQFVNVLIQGNATINGALSFGSAQTFVQPVTFNGAVTFAGAVAVHGSITVGATGGTGDLYYRSSSGPLSPLSMGAVGQFLGVVAGPALGWTSPSGLAIGTLVGGATQYSILYTDVNNKLAQDSATVIGPGVGLGIGLAPLHSLHVGYGRSPEIWLDTPNSNNQLRRIMFASANVSRWSLNSPLSAESGNNAGSDLELICYNDAANGYRTALYFTRATGNVTVGLNGDLGARLAVVGDNASSIVLGVQGAPSQTGALQVWQNSSGNVLAYVDAAGNFSAAGFTVTSFTASSVYAMTYYYQPGVGAPEKGVSSPIPLLNTNGQPVLLTFSGGILTGYGSAT